MVQRKQNQHSNAQTIHTNGTTPTRRYRLTDRYIKTVKLGDKKSMRIGDGRGKPPDFVLEVASRTTGALAGNETS